MDGENISSFNWMPDGNLLTSDFTRLVRTDAQGKNPTVLASDPLAGNAFSVCPAESMSYSRGHFMLARIP